MTLFTCGYKICGKCDEVKSINNFHLDKCTATKLTSWCKDCKKDYQDSNKRKIKSSRLTKVYGIDIDTYDSMMTSQGGRCDVCTELLLGNTINVDHCHTTGKVRGLLCSPCNFLLGNAKDNTFILNAAIKYLEKHNE
jgi:hypothetical protein